MFFSNPTLAHSIQEQGIRVEQGQIFIDLDALRKKQVATWE